MGKAFDSIKTGLPGRLHANLSRGARRQGASLNQYVLCLLAAREASSKGGAHA